MAGQQGRRGRFDEAELERLRENHPLSAFFQQHAGVRFRRAGAKWTGLCPFHNERTPSFTCDDARHRFRCFGCGASGDIFDAIQQFKGGKLPDAIRFLGGVQEITPQDRARIERKRRDMVEADEAERARTLSRVERAFADAQSIEWTHGAEYLKGRGLDPSPGWTFDLRFVPALRYRGFHDEAADEAQDLGEFPAMVAAIRNVHGDIIGLHRTYLDPVAPVKLKPPGDPRRNRAKKILGETAGGMIRLSETIGAQLAIGEGIETTRAWAMLDVCPGGISLAAAVSLGNLSGGSTGSIPHPDKANRVIPNGVPDPARPGVILPPSVEEVTLLGDGDSDKAMTRQRLRVAGKRFRHEGREVFVHMAPMGVDFSDVWQTQLKNTAEAGL